tara:strand:- start:440 stop:1186 length:747 start_codon:yes stop_codon:yes gene_type:complete
MIRSVNELIGYEIKSKDDRFGKLKDVLVDDQTWKIRFFDVDTGDWLPGRRVLISPNDLLEPDWENRIVPVELSRKKIEKSPILAANAPVSKQWQDMFYDYYGWPYYGYHGHVQEHLSVPSDDLIAEKEAIGNQLSYDPHLRSVHELIGYNLRDNLGQEFGAVDDFICESNDWEIQFLSVDVRKWIPSKNVLMAAEMVRSVEWSTSTMELDCSQEDVLRIPEFDPSVPINEETVRRLYDYYGRPIHTEY